MYLLVVHAAALCIRFLFNGAAPQNIKMNIRKFSRGELLADGIVHGVGVTLSLAGVLWLLSTAPPAPGTVTASLAVYGVSLIAMLSLSAANNLVKAIAWRSLLRRIDQSAIYVLIAGTYTALAPFVAATSFYVLVAIIWMVSLGAAFHTMFAVKERDGLSVATYIGLGWSGLVVSGPVSANLPSGGIAFLIAGGLLYSIGVVFHMWSRLSYQNAIWHLFVLAASICHFAAIAIASRETTVIAVVL